jgi:hypothetical protein
MSSQAYTPGLKRKEYTIIKKLRMLPVFGKVLVKENELVSYEDVIAKTSVPGNKHLIKISEKLDTYPEKLKEVMIKGVGEYCEKDEVIALKKGFLSLTKREFRSPISGIIERISGITGEIIISEPEVSLEINSHIPGKIEKVIPDQGALIRSFGSFIQGIFGIGGEVIGDLMMIAKNNNDIIDADMIPTSCENKILVCGSLVNGEFLVKARNNGACGIIVGGIMDEDLYELLGYEIGVAITGNEDIGITIIVMEGFGKMDMSENVFNILKKNDGKKACIDGTTQIRAGVIRPEVIIPKLEDEGINFSYMEDEIDNIKGLNLGTKIRIIREPYFGHLGIVVSLPPELQKIETESAVRILQVELEEGEIVTIPRANVEIIEE